MFKNTNFNHILIIITYVCHRQLIYYIILQLQFIPLNTKRLKWLKYQILNIIINNIKKIKYNNVEKYQSKNKKKIKILIFFPKYLFPIFNKYLRRLSTFFNSEYSW